MKKDFIEPKNIIIRMPNWVGDFVMATPVLTDVRKRFPKANITAMCKEPLCSLLEKEKEIDEIFCFKKPSFNLFERKEEKAITEKIAAGEYDLGILLTNSFSSAWWFYLGKVKMRLGYLGHFRNLLLNWGMKPSADVKKQHQIVTYKELLLPLGIEVSSTAPRLHLEEKEKSQALQLLKQQGYVEGQKILAINPGAAYGQAKCWLPERFSAVAKKALEDKDACVVFLGNGDHAPLIRSIMAGMDHRAINLAGKTSLRQLAAVLALSKVLLTNDSGPMHIAAALNVPIVALFGSTSTILTGPYPQGEVIAKQPSCAPCFQRVCSKDFRCMKAISVEDVWEKVKNFL